MVRPLCDLCRSASGARDKQLLFGARFHVLEERDGWAFGYDPRDGYVGYVEGAALGEVSQPTHRVVAQLAPLYSDADFKARDIGLLPFGSRLRVTETENGMARIEDGSWIMEQHIVPVTAHPTDWVHVAEGFFATPYLWGGNSALGIDCSGLVQSALWAAEIPCPRDADMQEGAFEIAEGQPQRGDLVFWKGHVAIMVSGEALLHANLHHGTVARESLD
ncbi:MAG: NlpC/P60 family protein, partial [Pseudomonadota bacterium]